MRKNHYARNQWPNEEDSLCTQLRRAARFPTDNGGGRSHLANRCDSKSLYTLDRRVVAGLIELNLPPTPALRLQAASGTSLGRRIRRTLKGDVRVSLSCRFFLFLALMRRKRLISNITRTAQRGHLWKS